MPDVGPARITEGVHSRTAAPLLVLIDMSSETHAIRLAPAELKDDCIAAVRAAGGDAATAEALAEATVQAELRRKPDVGATHLLDYLDALRDGRLNGSPHPRLEQPRPAVIRVDADEGAAQVSFRQALPSLVRSAREVGVAALSISNSFSTGELAHYTTHVAESGLLALACTNSPALMSAFGSREPITGTNPLSFALPHALGPRVFDQASSETAWVSVRDAAENDDAIPRGWALDPAGSPTTDAGEALDGALLPFGGVKGANIAFMVEMLAALSGGSFSIDAAPFDSGARSSRLGLFIAAIDPAAFDPGFADRAEAHHQRLADAHGVDFGRRKRLPAEIALPREVHEALRSTARAVPESSR